MGYELENAEIDGVMERFKHLADRKSRIFDSDLEAIITGQQAGTVGPWSLTWLNVVSHVHGENLPAASVTLAHNSGFTSTQTGTGDGPVDAIVDALEVHSTSVGEDAQGESSMRATCDGVEYSGHGLSTDIVAACAEALLEIINRASRQITRLQSSAA